MRPPRGGSRALRQAATKAGRVGHDMVGGERDHHRIAVALRARTRRRRRSRDRNRGAPARAGCRPRCRSRASCSATMKRYCALVMTIGRPNTAGSDTRSIVSWKVERAPNSGRNCFGRPSRDAGHSRVPAPPHMMSGMMRFERHGYRRIGLMHSRLSSVYRDTTRRNVRSRPRSASRDGNPTSRIRSSTSA